jgi:hypothetical protein
MDLSADAPHTPDRTRRAAELAAQAIRLLNHATRHDRGGLKYPADADRVTTELGILVSRLPQLLSQIAGWYEAEQAAGRLTVEYGPFEGYPVRAVSAVRTMMFNAAGIAEDLHAALEHAHRITAAIAGGPEDETDPPGRFFTICP